jgi:hypothetical protein
MIARSVLFPSQREVPSDGEGRLSGYSVDHSQIDRAGSTMSNLQRSSGSTTARRRGRISWPCDGGEEESEQWVKHGMLMTDMT